MTRWVALFRGINVGGKNRMPMEKLATRLESLGCRKVRTYIQSGNVVFEHRRRRASGLAAVIIDDIHQAFGFAPHLQLLNIDALRGIVASNPFPAATSDPKTLHVFFLASAPKTPELDELDRLKSRSERYRLTDNAFYLHAPDGIGRSKLAAQAEKRIGVKATARNWRTVSKVLELADN